MHPAVRRWTSRIPRCPHTVTSPSSPALHEELTHLLCVAAAAALRAGITSRLAMPLRDGRGVDFQGRPVARVQQLPPPGPPPSARRPRRSGAGWPQGDQMYGVVVVTACRPRRVRIGVLSAEAST
ncbi:hypothetical protein GFH48_02090 [Streptomyces fagopyri]|uniref:Uncharacterized protein n=1 Tax=Streptomyces fagopyri TaxID=2662397 RepID=A0A5Q0L6M1_9ACTN|nr:hypothetical protein GFH48_02090 [Streptomyces fagopyri]